ncbi:MAG: hypothetical protein RJA36_17 [Pseudomonadota bacterium]|jgi:tetraacyldisaccharide 4'-kinase
MSATLLQAWQRRGPLAAALWPLSRVHAAALGLRRLAYRLGLKRSERLPVPVLVVGNVVVGGAGKTPTVIALVQHLRARGWSPGVISRGYGREGDACLEIDAGNTGREAGDEPLLIARATGAPLVVGRSRLAAGRLLLERHPEIDIVVSDDGMQHWALARDLTVVVFDERGTGNGWLLPAGLLREPWPARPWGRGELLVLRTGRADAQVAPLPPARPGAAVHAAHRELADEAVDAQGRRHALAGLGAADGKALGALAGIAQPQRFFEMLRARGLRLERELALPDHAAGEELLAALAPGVRWLCTEKDAIKLFPLLATRPGLEVWAVPLQQTPEPAFWDELDRALERLSSRDGRQTP